MNNELFVLARTHLASRPERFSRKAAAKYLDVSVRTLEDWARLGKGPTYYKVGGKKVFYEKPALDEFMLTCRR